MPLYGFNPYKPYDNFPCFFESKIFELVKKAKTLIITEPYRYSNEQLAEPSINKEIPASKYKVYYNERGLVEFIETLKDMNSNASGDQLHFIFPIEVSPPGIRKYSLELCESLYQGGAKYYYNEKDELTRYVIDLSFDGIQYKSIEQNFYYNNSEVFETQKNIESRTKFENGLKTEEFRRFIPTGTEDLHLFFYDSQNRISIIQEFSNERINYSDDTDDYEKLEVLEMQYIIEFAYTQEPNGDTTITKLTHDLLDKETNKSVIIIDSNFNILKINDYNSKGRLNTFLDYNYTFDNFGNWIELKSILTSVHHDSSQTKHIPWVIKREIQY